MPKIAWRKLVHLGLVDLRLPPDVFWSLTPAELMVIAGVDTVAASTLSRSGLDALVELFPDEK